MTVHNIDYIELFVGDVTQATHYYRTALGFTLVAEADSSTGMAAGRSVVLAHGEARLVVTSGLKFDHPACRSVLKHGDGVRNVALRSSDAAGDFAAAVAAGAEPLAEPRHFDRGGGRVTVATVTVMDDLVHTIVERENPEGPFLPGLYRPVKDSGRGLDVIRTIDHVALCLLPGELEKMVDLYQRVFGLRHTYSEYISVGDQAMDSKVVQDVTRGITFTMVAPDLGTRHGQLVDFLEGYDGPGVQHVAFGTGDIVIAARELRERGVDMLRTPPGYYASLPGRGIDVGLEVDVLQELGLLVDHDESGQLIQVFTRSPYDRRTVFFELIQRMGARTFGSGNVKALYEALERERTEAHLPAGSPR